MYKQPTNDAVIALLKAELTTSPEWTVWGTYTTDIEYEVIHTCDDPEMYYDGVLEEVLTHTEEGCRACPEAYASCVESYGDEWGEMTEDQQEEAFDEYIIEEYMSGCDIEEYINLYTHSHHKMINHIFDYVDLEDFDWVPFGSCEYHDDGLIHYDDGDFAIMMGEPELKMISHAYNGDSRYLKDSTCTFVIALAVDVLLNGEVYTHYIYHKELTTHIDARCLPFC